MALQASFGERPVRKSKDWSPIDRMLAGKRASKRSASPMMQRLEEEPPPTLPKDPPWEKPRTFKASGTQTEKAWGEAEKKRIAALQAEVKALQAKVQESEAAQASAEGKVSELADSNADLRVSIDELRKEHASAAKVAEEEIRRLKEENEALRKDADELHKRGGQDAEYLKGQVDKAKRELKASRDECQELQTRLHELKQEAADLQVEKDILLERLEVEQAQMIARVDEMERRMKERPARQTKTFITEKEALDKMATAVDDGLKFVSPAVR
eukprot:TRINITY_DN21477_c0_g1_i1.p1 TRINITY_DN21477_c0_g1~~TRINITY_DN21477_c0_g1_i1.p1  ORF type:complete len:271 (+),score=98.32 TRINITY_DN21477_c0_g1_i1:134-946(+)